MKRSFIIVVAILILLVLAGCIRPQEQEELLIEEFPENEVQFELGSVSGLKSSYRIIIQRVHVGNVYAWEEDNSLFLKFEGIDGWLFTETRAATSLTIEGFPRDNKSKIDPSQFPGETHNPPVLTYTMELPLGNLNDGQIVYFGTFVRLINFDFNGRRVKAEYGVCINSFIYHDDTPVVDKKPKLEGDIDDPLVRGFTYDWEIEKSVDPESVELKLGESATLTYTINATRTPVEGDFALSGAVNLNSTGELPASSIAITVMLQYLLGDVYTDLEGFTAINVDTSATPTLNPGESSSYKYDFAFDPKEGVDEYRIRASITADDLFPFTLDATFTLSGLAESTDATATIADQLKDIQSEIPGGFSAAYIPPTTGNWILEQPGDGTQTFSIVYEVLLTNEKIEDPQQDFYILDNTATLTEYDSKTEHSDDARVIITVPQPFIDNPDLKIENEHDMEWDQEKAYSWEIEKSATPESIELEEGEDGTFTYTLLATRTVKETNIATLTGLATVTNTGNVPLTNIAVEIILEDADGVEIDKYTTTIAALAVGAKEGLPYSFTFDPTGYEAPFKVIAKATAGTASDEVQTDQLLPTPNVTEIDKDAYVEDTFDQFIVTGIAIEGNIYREWLNIIEGNDWNSLTSSWSVSYTVVATNTGAAPGEYPLDNTATVTEDDTKEESSDDATVTITVPAPGLGAEVDVQVSREDEIEYDWSIVKSVDPEEVTLDQGEEATIGYTIQVTRGNAFTTDSTYTVTVNVSVSNTGQGAAQGVKVTLTIPELSVLDTLAEGITIGVGETKNYSETYTTKNFNASYTATVDVTSSNNADLQVSKTGDTPTELNVVEEIDETATVNDLITNVPEGFEIDPATLERDWNLTGSDTLTYSLVLKNIEALPGTYYLTNTATVTEDDTKEESSDDATVTITVPAPGLGAEVDVQVSREDEIEYDWSIVKSVDPEEVTLDQGEEATIGYTIQVTRGNAFTTDSTYTVTVNVSVSNTGQGAAQGVKVTLTIPELSVLDTLAEGITIGVGETKNYSETYTTKNFNASYTATVDVTSSNNADLQVSKTGDTPTELNVVEEIDETATVNDLITNVPEGFEIDPATLERDWNLTGSDTLTYSLVLKNIEALPGTYYLTNTATVTEDDTKEESSDDATVTITVPAPGLGAEVDVQVSREDEIEYDWSIVKSVDPEEVTLDQGEEATIGYTIQVTRGNAFTTDSTYTVTVNVSVSNTGQGAAQGVKVTLTIPELSVLDTLAEGITIGVGETKNYSETYTTKNFNASYTATVDVTSSNNADLQVSKTGDTPTELNVVEEIDETATVNDLITNVPEGFEIDPATLERDWNLTGSDTLTYSLVLKNIEALPGTYYLTNTATVTEDDTKEESSDDATVTITVPAPGLGAEVDVQVSREDEIEYDWSIVKSVDPEEVTLDQGEEATIGYTIQVTRGNAFTTDSTYTVTVNVSVSNTGQGAAQGVKVTLTIPELSVLDTLAEGITIGVGETKNYSETYTTKNFNASYTATVDVTSSNNADLQVSKTGDTPTELNVVEEIDETATVNDLITNVPEGFEIDPATLERDWNLTGSDTLTYSLVLKNIEALPGTYYLTNTATVTEDDTKEESSDDATVTITVPAPGLGAEVDVQVSREDEIEYDWSIVKSVDPEEVTLDQGEEATIGYTIQVTRGNAFTTDSTYTVTVNVSVSNTGQGAAQGVKVTLTIPELSVLDTLAEGITIGVGETKNYSETYTTKNFNASYTATVDVTSSNNADLQVSKTGDTPTELNVVEEIDETATVNDLITNVPEGFEIDPATLERDWNLTGSDTLTYSLVLKNIEALPGTYYLTNTATVTEDDTKEESSDDATVTITVPAPGLGAEVDVQVSREDEIEYDWSIVKSVDPEEVTLDQGEEATIGYTIQVTRGNAFTTDSTYTVTVNVSVSNTGQGAAQGVKVTLTIPELSVLDTLAEGITIGVGETKNYSETYTTKNFNASYTATVDVTSSNNADLQVSKTGDTPTELNVVEEIDETATVNDLITNVPEGFEIDPATLERDWNLTGSDTLTYSLVLKNIEALPGTYYLTNTATVTEDDTKEESSDDATVTITVPAPGLGAEVDVQVSREDEIEYDWSIVKSVDPEEVTLDQGEEATIGYTIQVTRGNAFTTDSTYTVTVNVSVSNTGQGAAQGVKVTLTIPELSVLDTLAEGITIGVGETKNYSETYTTKNFNASYTATVDVTSSNNADLQVSKTGDTPTELNVVEEIDETATVNDLITNVPEGFEIDPATLERDWNLTGSDTLTYSLVLKNIEALPGTYYLTNTATVTEDDTKEESSDDATVTITVPAPGLGAEVDVQVSREDEIEYDWSIVKSVDPEEVTLDQGEEATIGYTIQVTRGNAFTTDSTYTVTVNVSVSNTGQGAAQGVKVTLTIPELSVLDTLAEGITIGVGETKNYSETYTTKNFNASYTATVDVTSSNNADLQVSKTGDTPTELNVVEEIDETATVNDLITNVPEGFEIDPATLERDWNLTGSDTLTYSLVLKNIEALPGTYYLTNTATVTEDDTKEESSDDATVTITVPAPGLGAEVDVQVSREDEIEYDWSIVKSVDPEEVTLDQGEEATIGYTIQVTRGNAFTTDSTYTVTVNVSVSNTGQGAAQGVKVTLTIPELSVLDTLAEGITIGVGETKNYSETYTTKNFNASYTATVDVTSSNNADLQVSKTGDTPTELNVVEEIDETATVNDLITNVPEGFEIDPATLERDWNLTGSDTLTYSLVLKNIEALPGTYYLTNTATVTEDDTKEESSDDATVTITVPAPGLGAEVDVQVSREDEIEYDWSIVKSVDPEEVTLDQGEEATIGYTIQVTRGNAFTTDSTYTVTVNVSVSNTGQGAAQGVKVTLTIPELSVLDTLAEGITIGVGETKNYSETYTTKNFNASYTATVDVTSSNNADLQVSKTGDTPTELNVVEEIDETATVNDLITNVPEGFEIDPATLERDWNLTGSDTLTYSLVLKNIEALPGTYYLTNTATVTEDDTKEESSDDATVTITVPKTVKLEAEVAAEFFWIRENIYEWEIDKKANPTLIIFQVNEFEKDIEYTITATKTLDSVVDTHSYSGSVKVTNNGNSEAQNVKLTITLQYYDGSDWITIQTLPEVELGSIASGADKTHGFGPIVFTPVDTNAQHRVKVEVSADAPANTDEAYDVSSLSITGTTETNATAVLDDEFTYVPDGFAIVSTDPDPLPFPIHLTDSAVVQFSITIRKFSFEGSGSISYKLNQLGAYISATVTGYMAGTYPGWCIQVNVSGIGGPYTIQDIYDGGAPDSKMAKANYILNRYRDELYPDGVDYRHIQIAIWAIMEGSLNWNSWRKMFDPNVPDGDKPLVQAIIDTAKDSFLPGCGDVVLMKALSADKQDVILEIVFPCEEEEFRLENTATLTSELQEIWDDAVVEIKLTPTDPETWGEETAWGGNYEGGGSGWWYYFDTNGPATQDIYAGQNKVAGASVTYKDGKLTIVLGPNMRLQSVSEPVKIQSYATGALPTSRPSPGTFTTYEGSNLVVPVSPARYFAIHLDVEVLQ